MGFLWPVFYKLLFLSDAEILHVRDTWEKISLGLFKDIPVSLFFNYLPQHHSIVYTDSVAMLTYCVKKNSILQKD